RGTRRAGRGWQRRVRPAGTGRPKRARPHGCSGTSERWLAAWENELSVITRGAGKEFLREKHLGGTADHHLARRHAYGEVSLPGRKNQVIALASQQLDGAPLVLVIIDADIHQRPTLVVQNGRGWHSDGRLRRGPGGSYFGAHLHARPPEGRGDVAVLRQMR